ncbi:MULTISPECIES: hypothetical protein [unclassified Knoellia]|uniref:hypothetical protein n=1 Tax=Knoellia altitudinis TaxID=3404795 RepID=UPI00360942A8
MTQYDVRPDDIGGHSKKVGSFTDRLSTASSAAQTTLTTDAFGIINQPLALLAVGIAGVAKTTVSNLSMDMEETMIGLNNTVTQYTSDDDNAKQSVENVGMQ